MNPVPPNTSANFLAVDIGNTDLKLGAFFVSDVQKSFRLLDAWRMSRHGHSVETFEALLNAFFEDYKNTLTEVKTLAFCTSVPLLVAPLVQCAMRWLTPGDQLEIFMLDPGSIQLSIHVPNYPLNQIGPDRLANLMALDGMYRRQPAIVLDFGTATTIDALNDQGEFLGGCIVPGLQVFCNTLPQVTARLPMMDNALLETQYPFGNNTQECLYRGHGIGYVAMISSILEKMKRRMPSNTIVVATGGLAERYVQLAKADKLIRLEPALTLTGIFQAYLVNQRIMQPGVEPGNNLNPKPNTHPNPRSTQSDPQSF